jgi:hypothetical protein
LGAFDTSAETPVYLEDPFEDFVEYGKLTIAGLRVPGT